MSGTLWQASPGTIVFVLVIAAFALGVGSYVVFRRRHIASRAAGHSQLIEVPQRLIEVIAVVGGLLFLVAGFAIAALAVVLIITSAAHQAG